MALNSGIQTNQMLTKDDEVCIPRLSSILLAVKTPKFLAIILDQSFGNFVISFLKYVLQFFKGKLFHKMQKLNSLREIL